METFKRLNWYGAALAKSTTPEAFCDDLDAAAHDGVNVSAELIKASNWLAENPGKRKKLLGKFLLGWIGRAVPGSQQPLFTRETIEQKQARQQNYDDLPEGWQ